MVVVVVVQDLCVCHRQVVGPSEHEPDVRWRNVRPRLHEPGARPRAVGAARAEIRRVFRLRALHDVPRRHPLRVDRVVRPSDRELDAPAVACCFETSPGIAAGSGWGCRCRCGLGLGLGLRSAECELQDRVQGGRGRCGFIDVAARVERDFCRCQGRQPGHDAAVERVADEYVARRAHEVARPGCVGFNLCWVALDEARVGVPLRFFVLSPSLDLLATTGGRRVSYGVVRPLLCDRYILRETVASTRRAEIAHELRRCRVGGAMRQRSPAW